jgi:hypothetical protein
MVIRRDARMPTPSVLSRVIVSAIVPFSTPR